MLVDGLNELTRFDVHRDHTLNSRQQQNPCESHNLHHYRRPYATFFKPLNADNPHNGSTQCEKVNITAAVYGHQPPL